MNKVEFSFEKILLTIKVTKEYYFITVSIF